MPNSLLTLEDLNRLSIERTVSAVDPLATPPQTPDNVSVTARSLGLLVQWSRVEGVDGYNVIVSGTEDMANPINQVRVPGESSLEYFLNTGHVSVSRYIAVQSYRGNAFSDYSSVVSATSTQAVSGSDFPGDMTYNNSEDTLCTVTLTTTGGTLYIIGSASLSFNGGNKDTFFRIREDGAILQGAEVKAVAKDTSSGFGNLALAFTFSTPSAGSHTYTLTAQNNTDTNVCTAARPGLCVMEVPLLISSAAPTPPSAVVSPPTTEYIPTGPGQRYGGY